MADSSSIKCPSSCDSDSMTNSKYAGIVFKDVSESYPTDGDIVIRFVKMSNLEESPNDFVALLKIGWKNLNKEAITSVPLSGHVTRESSGDSTVTLASGTFNDKIQDGEYYQFCYVSNGSVLGASTPFCIRRPASDDMMMMATAGDANDTDDEEFIVVKSEQALMQERLNQLVTSNGELDYRCKSLSMKLIASNKEIERLKNEKLRLENVSKSRHDAVEHVHRLLDETRKKETEHERVVNSLITAKNLLTQKLNHAEEESRHKSDLFKKLEQEYKRSMELVGKLIEDKERMTSEKDNLEQSVIQGKKAIEILESKYIKLAGEHESLRAENEKKSQIASEREKLRSDITSLMQQLEISAMSANGYKEENRTLNLELNKTREILVLTQEKLAIQEKKLKEVEEANGQKSPASEEVVQDLTQRLRKAAEEYVELKKSKIKTDAKYARLKGKVDVFMQASRTTPKVTPTSAMDTAEQGAVGGVDGPSAPVEQAAREVNDVLENSTKDTDIILLPCNICHEQIVCVVGDLAPMTRHLEIEHKQRVCPVCSQLFDQTMAGVEDYFQLHVENHFDDNMYPRLGSGFEAVGGGDY